MSSNSGGARRRARARIFRALVVAVGTALVPAPASAETSAETGAEVPRIILGLYDGGNGGQL